MIIITHHKDRVVQIENNSVSVSGDKGLHLTASIIKLAKEYPDTLLVWVAKEYRDFLNLDYFRNNKNFKNTLQSFNPGDNYMPNDIGYVEETLFINVNKEVKYATWLMSATVGCAMSFIFNSIKSTISRNTPFDYYLNSIAKQAMPQGLLCYSNPALLITSETLSTSTNSLTIKQFFDFIKGNYKKRWLFLLAFQQLIFEKRFTFHYAFLAFFKKKDTVIFKPLLEELAQNKSKETIDVLIPTMGRSDYLYNVLIDLKNQYLVPKNIIIVEQNAAPESVTQLNYIYDEKWPFEIKHTFIHQTGACNARNIALEQVTSDWVFFADDDIRIPENSLENAVMIANSNNFSAVTLSCLQKGEREKIGRIIQWSGFGSNTSLVRSEKIKNLRFNMGFEFGYGEDGDFGMQLRNQGADVLYAPSIQLLHLKAPIGGFRQKVNYEWSEEKNYPKPSPTVMLYKLKHLSATQLNSYKFLLFVKNYGLFKMKNPFTYFGQMNKSWKTSLVWAQKLAQRHG